MHWPIIRKHPAAEPAVAATSTAAQGAFTWDRARQGLTGLPADQGLNIAYEAVTRHATSALKEHVALRWLGKDGHVQDYSFAQLDALSNRFANALRLLGVGPGERVFTLLGRIPAFYIAALGTWKRGAVLCPLFSAFGPEPIAARLNIGGGRVLVTTAHLYYRRQLAELKSRLPPLMQTILVDGEVPSGSGVHGWDTLMNAADSHFVIPPTAPEDLALLNFTSGTTGTPKGAMHVHAGVLTPYLTGQTALDLRPDDLYWCTADPGWVTGVVYGLIAPLVNGVTSLIDEAEFNAERWYGILQDQRVTVWYTAPTALRLLMKAGKVQDYDFSTLRFAASVGEPLNPEAVGWGQETLGVPIHDNWWQTETGGIMLANVAALDIKPGAMGRPLPGVEAAVVERTRLGGVRLLHAPDTVGELALRMGWPSMFRGYWQEDKRYRQCFADGYYLTGDLVRRDKDGYFWFVGRADDVIKTAGHLIGPFEVESTLLEHPAVAEAGVIGKPDPVALTIIKAFVALKPGYAPSDALRRELLALARQRLGVAVAPRELEFHPALPRTRSGKIMRRLLKARELGLPEGDLSALENAGD